VKKTQTNLYLSLFVWRVVFNHPIAADIAAKARCVA